MSCSYVLKMWFVIDVISDFWKETLYNDKEKPTHNPTFGSDFFKFLFPVHDSPIKPYDLSPLSCQNTGSKTENIDVKQYFLYF